jgi:DNA polymerase-3 subunit gamma/tau
MCARVLLPGADVDDRGVHARLDRLERRIGVTGASTVAKPAPAKPALAQEEVTLAPTPQAVQVAAPLPSQTAKPVATPTPTDETKPAKPESQSGGLTVTDVRRLWPDVLEEVKGKRRFTWILLSQNAQVAEVRNGTLLLAMSNPGARDSFARGGNEDVLREAMVVVMGADFAVETMVDPSAIASTGSSRTPPAPEHRPAAPAPDSSKARSTNGVRNETAEDRDAVASRDDSDLDEDAASHTELLARHLGAEIIAEEDHGA